MTFSWRHVLASLHRAWASLVVYELAASTLIGAMIGPLALTAAYQLIGLRGDSALGNWEIVDFLLSPMGALAFVLGASLMFCLLLMEYSGLIFLVDAALRGRSLTVRRVVAGLLAAAPGMLCLAVLLTSLAIVVSLPFVGMGAGAYWWLLGDADVNYYITKQPPRFWIAAAVGIALVGGWFVAMVWFFVRWAFAAPACMLEGQNWLGALRTSARMTRGRIWRLLSIFVGWQLLRSAAFVAAIAGLDQIHDAFTAASGGKLTILVWSTAALLLLDGTALQLLGAAFAVGTAVLISREYELARQSVSGPSSAVAFDHSPAPQTEGSAWRAWTAFVALVVLGPATSLGYAFLWTKQIVEHRPAMVTGHRAGSKAAPENSIAALRRSIEVGADYVEIDVQQTADGQVVLMHDRDLRRTTGDVRELNDVKLKDLKSLRLRDSRGWSDEKVPTLAQFIAACDGRMRINVELKDFGRTPNLALAALEVLRMQGFTQRAVVSCFQMTPLRQIKEAEPKLPVGIILSAAQGDVSRLPVDFLSLHQRLARGGLVRQAHRQGKEVHVWGVQNNEIALRLLDIGCDNLITSDPASIRELVDGYAGLGDVERMLLRLRRWMRE